MQGVFLFPLSRSAGLATVENGRKYIHGKTCSHKNWLRDFITLRSILDSTSIFLLHISIYSSHNNGEKRNHN